MQPKEIHPYVDKFPLTKAYKYLVIGTFPPAEKLGPNRIRKFSIDYFYGNVASFWNIIKKIYPNYIFSVVEHIQGWQEDYSVGITDTIISCRRKKQESTSDSDLLIEWDDYNHKLKNYILDNLNYIEKLIFTSGINCNNALFNFKIIMGDDFKKVIDKIFNLPSPSNGSNRSYFNMNKNTLGLEGGFYNFVINNTDEKTRLFIQNSFKIKSSGVSDTKVKRIPDGILSKYKLYMYEKVFPRNR